MVWGALLSGGKALLSVLFPLANLAFLAQAAVDMVSGDEENEVVPPGVKPEMGQAQSLAARYIPDVSLPGGMHGLQAQLAVLTAEGAVDAVRDENWRVHTLERIRNELERLQQVGTLGSFLDQWITLPQERRRNTDVANLMDCLYYAALGMFEATPALFYYITPHQFFSTILVTSLAEPDLMNGILGSGEAFEEISRGRKVAFDMEPAFDKPVDRAALVADAVHKSVLKPGLSKRFKVQFSLLADPQAVLEAARIMKACAIAIEALGRPPAILEPVPTKPQVLPGDKSLQLLYDAYAYAQKRNAEQKGYAFDETYDDDESFGISREARFFFGGLGDALIGGLKNVLGKAGTQLAGNALSAAANFIPGVGPVVSTAIKTATSALPAIAQMTGVPVDNVLGMQEMGKAMKKAEKQAKKAKKAALTSTQELPSYASVLSAANGLSPVYRAISSENPTMVQMVDTLVDETAPKVELDRFTLRDRFGDIVRWQVGEIPKPIFVTREAFWAQAAVDVRQMMSDVAWYLTNASASAPTPTGSTTSKGKKKPKDDGDGLGGLLEKWGGKLLDLIGLGDDDEEDEEEDDSDDDPLPPIHVPPSPTPSTSSVQYWRLRGTGDIHTSDCYLLQRAEPDGIVPATKNDGPPCYYCRRDDWLKEVPHV
jgi:hypothetical protein